MKTIQLLSRLKRREFHVFRKFLLSPYFNQDEIYLQLFEAFLPAYPHFENVDKAALFRSLFPKVILTTQKINEYLSRFSRLLEQFFLQQEFRQQKIHQRDLQLKTYQERNLPEWFNQVAQQQAKQLHQQAPLHWENMLFLWLAHHRQENYPQAGNLPSAFNTIPTHYLDTYFVLNKLRYLCDFKAKKGFYKEEYSFEFEDVICQFAEQSLPKHPIVHLYFHLVQLFQNWTADSFQSCLALYYKQYHNLANDDQHFILLNMANLLNAQISEGASDYINTLFELYQFGIADHLFLKKYPLRESTFLNICTVGARLKKVKWTQTFIQNHQHLLPVTTKASALTLSKALLLFHSGQFKVVLDQFHFSRPNHIYYKLRIRSLKVRCLLEMHLQDTSYYSALCNAITNDRQFFNRNKKLQPKIKQRYLNMNKAVLKIAELRRYGWGTVSLHYDLIDWIENLSAIIGKDWLLEKLKTGGYPI